MTVRELINWLEEFDDDQTVMIGMYQNYGSNFAMNISEVTEAKCDKFYEFEDDDEYIVYLIEGRQVGVISED